MDIVGKRTDGYHDLETVFVPVPLTDVLEIVPAKKEKSFTITGTPLEGSSENNLCIKAYNLLKEKFTSLPPVRLHLHKIIPAGAGLGGGSSDAAFTLRILNEIFELKLTQEYLLQMALQLGSDCPFFIINQPCLATGRGELLEKIELNLSAYHMMIVNPGIHISTAAMFGKIQPVLPSASLKEKIKLPIEQWKEEIKNDFELPVFELHPEIGEIKDRLYKAGAVYASLSGSGSSVYGLFKKEETIRTNLFPHYFTFITN